MKNIHNVAGGISAVELRLTYKIYILYLNKNAIIQEFLA